MQVPLRFGPDLPLAFCVLGSGSAGNAVVFECGGRRLLVDAGFSCRQLEKRLAAVGAAPDEFEGIVVTHEHGDHVRGAKRFAKRHRVPVLASSGTLTAARLRTAAAGTVTLKPGRPYELATFRLEPFSVPHDARDPIGVVVESPGGRRVGVVSDLGALAAATRDRLRDLDALILESNHDVEMLRSGPYPWVLKRRIAGGRGHLSNDDAARGLLEVLDDRLRTVVLYHLSETNNLPVLAEEATRGELERRGASVDVVLSQQAAPGPWLTAGPAAPA